MLAVGAPDGTSRHDTALFSMSAIIARLETGIMGCHVECPVVLRPMPKGVGMKVGKKDVACGGENDGKLA